MRKYGIVDVAVGVVLRVVVVVGWVMRVGSERGGGSSGTEQHLWGLGVLARYFAKNYPYLYASFNAAVSPNLS
jgi:hypothetical protein